MNFDHVFTVDPVRQQHLEKLLQEHAPEAAEADSLSELIWESDPEHKYIQVRDGTIRVLHYVPERQAGRPVIRRPIVFLPGWGTIPEGFAEFLQVVDGQTECYYVETREKNSSRLDRSRARMDMDQLAEDVQAVLNIAGPHSVLMGTCWGSTVIAHGLARGIITAETVVLFDPMHALWFPKWLLNWVVPVVPLWLWSILKPLAKQIALWGMNEPVQRARAELFIDNADLWKWKKAALQVQGVNLYQEMPKIRQEILIMNGVKDKIHDRSHYPRLAALARKGRFFYLPVDESLREKLMGLVAVLFSTEEISHRNGGQPTVLQQFERDLT